MAPQAQSTTFSPRPLRPTFTKRQVESPSVVTEPATPTVSSTTVVVAPPSVTPSTLPSGGSKVNVGAIVGGVLGGVALIILITLGVWLGLRRKRVQNRRGSSSRSRGMQEYAGSNHQRMLSDVPLLGERSLGRSTIGGSPATGSGEDQEYIYEPFQPPTSLARGGYASLGVDDPASSFLHITPLIPSQQPPSTLGHLPSPSRAYPEPQTMKHLPSVPQDVTTMSPSTSEPGATNLQRNVSIAPSVATTESMYSMPSAANSPPPVSEIPPIPPIPAQYLHARLAQLPPSLTPTRRAEPPPQLEFDDMAVSQALRDRAKRSPPRQFTNISHIERTGSITSLTSTDEAELRRIRSRAKGKQKSMTMDTVTEAHTEHSGYTESPVDPIIPELTPRKSGKGRSTENLLLSQQLMATGSPRIIVDVEERMRAIEEEEEAKLHTTEDATVPEQRKEKRTTKDYLLPQLPDFESLRMGSPSPRSSRGPSRTPTPQPPPVVQTLSNSSTAESLSSGSVNTPTLLHRFPNPPLQASSQRKGTNDTVNSDFTIIPPPEPLDPNSPTPVYDLARSSSSTQPLSPPLFFLRDVAESESDPDSSVSRSTTASGSTSTTAVLRNSNPFKTATVADLNMNTGVEVNMSPPPSMTDFGAVVSSPTVTLAPKQKSVLPSVFPAGHRLSDQSERTLVGTPRPDDAGTGNDKRHSPAQGSISSSRMQPSQPGHDRTGSNTTTEASDVPSSLRPSLPGRSPARQSSFPITSPPPSASTPPTTAIPPSLRPNAGIPAARGTRTSAVPPRLGPSGSVSGPRNRTGPGVPASLRAGSGTERGR